MLFKELIIITPVSPRAQRLVCHVQRAAAIKQGDVDALISPSSFGTGCSRTHMLSRMEI